MSGIFIWYVLLISKGVYFIKNIMIANRVYRLLKDSRLQNGIEFKAGQELEIVMDMVYVQGYPLPLNVQATVYNWITSNPTIFKDDTRNF